MVLEAYAQGGTKRIGGIISGASHIIGIQLRKMIEIFNEGNVQEAAERIQAHPRIRSARVFKELPDRLIVRIVEKIPAAMIVANQA